MQANIERELKFDVDPGFTLPALSAVVGRAEPIAEQELDTTYFDSPDGRLRTLGITLRFRRDGSSGKGKWTLKVPLPPDQVDLPGARSEIDWPSRAARPPAGVRSVLAGVLGSAPLEALVQLRSRRRRHLVHDAGETRAWAEIDDDEVSVSGGPRDGTRFRQIEVELLEYASGDGRPGELAGFLERAGARPSVLSKFALATGSDLGAPAGGVEIGPDPASGFVAVIRRDLDALLLADCRLRVAADAGSDGTPGLAEAASAVAALRRLRSDLRTMEPVLDPAWSAQVAEPLRSAAASLNRLTDADSLLLRLETAAGQESGLLVGSQEPGDMDHLLQRLGSERHLRWLQTRSDLAAGSYLQTLERLREAAVRPRLTARYGPGGAPLDLLALVAANWRVVTDGLAGQGVEGDLASLRSLCGRVGRLRYSAEAAAALASRRRGSARMGRRALALQAALESVLDSARAAATLSEMATHPSCTPSAAFAAGRVSGLIEVEGRARREELPALVERLAGPRLVDWVEKVESGRR